MKFQTYQVQNDLVYSDLLKSPNFTINLNSPYSKTVKACLMNIKNIQNHHLKYKDLQCTSSCLAKKERSPSVVSFTFSGATK